MSIKKIIPCLDFYNGRVVKGINFVNLVDAGDPVACASAYFKAGADELTFLDISATNDNRKTVAEMVSKVAEQVSIPFTVGGGIRVLDDFEVILKAGANKIGVNSAAVKRPELITEAAMRFGSPCVVVAIDAKERADGSGWDVYINGGKVNTGLDAVEWAVKIPVTASGGAGALEHFHDAIIKGKADAVLAASLFHFGEINITELKHYLAKEGIEVRI